MKTKKNITIHDISKKLNLSIATVSRALNNSSDVKPHTKAKILAAASELNYHQNQVAKALKSGQSKFVGVIVPFLNHNFFSTVIGGIENSLSKEGYHVAIYQSHENFEIEQKHIMALLNAQVDGIFLSVSKQTKDYSHINEVLRKEKPLIFFDRKINVPNTSSVTIDDFGAAYEVTTHLIKQGAKKIAHFAGDFNLDIYQNRFDGFMKALKDHNLTFDRRFFYKTDQNIEGGIEGMRSIWQYPEKPDAIFSSSDFALAGAIQVIREYGLIIPEDLLIAGYSNEPFTQFMDIPITTVDQQASLMGHKAAEIFLNKMHKVETVTKENQLVLKPKLLIRKSTSIKRI